MISLRSLAVLAALLLLFHAMNPGAIALESNLDCSTLCMFG